MKKIVKGAIAICAMLGLLLPSCKQDMSKVYEENDPLVKNMDKTAKPGDDFFLYANGQWLKITPSPALIHHGG